MAREQARKRAEAAIADAERSAAEKRLRDKEEAQNLEKVAANYLSAVEQVLCVYVCMYICMYIHVCMY